MAENEADRGRETGMAIHEPPAGPFTGYRDAAAAVARLEEIFETNTAFLRDAFQQFLAGDIPQGRVRACYPEIRLVTETHGRVDSRLAYGFVSGPGVHSTSVTRPDLFRDYLLEQVELLIRNHEVPVEVGVSDLPIPLHFAFYDGTHVEGAAVALQRPLAERGVPTPVAGAPPPKLFNRVVRIEGETDYEYFYVLTYLPDLQWWESAGVVGCQRQRSAEAAYEGARQHGRSVHRRSRRYRRTC